MRRRASGAGRAAPIRGCGDLLGRIRSWSRARLFARLDPSVAPLASALLLGQREGIEPEVNDAFARTGTTHLLAISGLQLQALALALLVVFRVAGIRRKPAYLGVGVAMIGYAVVVGPAPSVVRATVMTATFCLASISGRLNRPANTLALAALGYIGCQSVVSVRRGLSAFIPGDRCSDLAGGAVGCVHSHRHRQAAQPVPRSGDAARRARARVRTGLAWCLAARGVVVVDGLVASTVVWLAALPLVAMRFHLVSPIGVLLNIPLIPMTTAAMMLGGLALVLSTVWGPLGGPPAWCAAGLLKLTRAIVLWGVEQRWGHRFVVGPAWGWVLVFYVLLGLAVVALTQRVELGWLSAGRSLRALPWWLLAAWVVPGWLFSGILTPRAATTEAEFLAVGHGLAVLFAHTGRPSLSVRLRAAGRPERRAADRRAGALGAGVSRIDAVFLSHADQDHYDGLIDLLDRFQIGVVRITPDFGGDANPAADRPARTYSSPPDPDQAVTAPDSGKLPASPCGPASARRLGPAGHRQRPQHRARCRLRRPPHAVDRRSRALRPR